MSTVVEVVCLLLFVYYLILLVRIVLSFIPRVPAPIAPVARLVAAVTDPLLVPLRRVIPPVRLGGGGLDLSPLVVFLGLSVVQSLLGCR